MKEIEEIRRIDAVKMSILLKRICRFNLNLTKIPEAFFTETDQTILKLIWSHKRCQWAKYFEKRKTMLEASHVQISNYDTKLS